MRRFFQKAAAFFVRHVGLYGVRILANTDAVMLETPMVRRLIGALFRQRQATARGHRADHGNRRHVGD